MRKTINALMAVATVFWVVVLVAYISYYAPALQTLKEYVEPAITSIGSQVGFIWLNFAKISTFAFGTIATLIFLGQREKPLE